MMFGRLFNVLSGFDVAIEALSVLANQVRVRVSG